MAERDVIIAYLKRIEAAQTAQAADLLRMDAKLNVLTHEALRPVSGAVENPPVVAQPALSVAAASGRGRVSPVRKNGASDTLKTRKNGASDTLKTRKNAVSQSMFEKCAPRILELLMRDNHRYRGCSTAVLRRELDISADTLLRICARLVDEGLLRSSKEGNDGLLHRVPMQRDEAVKSFLVKLSPAPAVLSWSLP